MIAEVTALLIQCPIEVIKQNSQYTNNTSSLKHLKNIWKEQKLRGMFTGYRDLLLREVTCTVLEFGILEFLLKNSSYFYKPKKLPFPFSYLLTPEEFQKGMMGGIAYGIAGFLTTPFDLIKSRRMVNTMPALSIASCFKHVYKESGIVGLYRGCISRTVLTGLGGLIYYCAFFRILDYMGIYSIFMGNRGEKH